MKTLNRSAIGPLRLCVCLALLGDATARVHAATITVSSTADSGAGTLRAALASAANGDTINASGVSGTITLTNGELLVTELDPNLLVRRLRVAVGQ